MQNDGEFSGFAGLGPVNTMRMPFHGGHFSQALGKKKRGKKIAAHKIHQRRMEEYVLKIQYMISF